MKIRVSIFHFLSSSVLLSLLLAIPAHASSERGRSFGVFVGGSLTRSFATVEQSGVNAKLNGWGNFGEVGLDLPFSDTFGFSPSIEVGETQLVNKYRSDTYLDQTKIGAQSVRGLFYYKGFEVGGSYRKLDVDLRTISTVSGTSNANVDGSGSSYFVGYSFTYQNVLRTGVAVESTQFNVENFKFNDISVGLRIQILLSGILGRD